ncbi:histidine kinase [Rhizobium sp. L18]|nr:histidine kinase [Rhizobium sp. L18]
MSGAGLAVAYRRRQPELGNVFFGDDRHSQVGHQLTSDAVLLGKPYHEGGLTRAPARFRKK